MTPQFPWGQRALDHVTSLFKLLPAGRGSATAAEARAAEFVRGRLVELGITDTHLQAFTGLRSIWLFLAMAYGFALMGHAAFWLLRPPLGEAPALGLSILAFAFGGYLLYRKMAFRNYPMRTSLPHGPSQNVVAVLPARGEVQNHVVLTAHLDSHRAVGWFASNPLVFFYFVTSPLGTYGFATAPGLYALSVLTGLKFLAWGGLFLLVFHFLGWFTGITADLGPYSPGANDNASSVGTLLSLAERLRQSPLEHTETWLAFTGCEETGCDGMVAFLKVYGDRLKHALFINLEGVGIGSRMAYLRTEGVLRPRRIPSWVEKLVAELTPELDAVVQPLSVAGLGAFTETGAVWEYGFEGVCFQALRQDSPWPPEWHRLSDQPNRLEPEALDRAHHLVWTILQKLDRESRK